MVGEDEDSTTGPKSAAVDNRERSNLSRSVVVPLGGVIAWSPSLLGVLTNSGLIENPSVRQMDR
jgi:hypothetical protein